MKEFLKLRSNILRVLLIAAMTLIVVKLFSIQVIHHDEYVAQAEAQHTMQNTIVAKRGEIYMMDGDEPVPIAMNSKVWSVIIDPQITRGDRDNVEKVLRENAADYLIRKNFDDAYSSSTLRYYVVARNVPYKNAQAIKEAELPGVYFQGSTKRVYPEGELASGLLGFVNQDGKGQYGVEQALNEELSGVNGVLKTVKDVNNIPLTIGDDNVKVPAVDGKSVVLSIDRNIQNKAEQILAKKLKEYKISHGTMIVMDPGNGQILSIASLPNYDPENYGKVEDAEVFQTNATMDAYEVASMCKTFAFAAAIDMDKMTPESTFYNSGKTVIDGWTINNSSKGHIGQQNMQQALAYSLNTGSIQALRWLGDSETEITQKGKERLYDYYYNKFWLGKYTGIEIAESPGYIVAPDDEDATNARYANMTFGQGMTITALQVATAFSSVVNGGEYFKPTVVAGYIEDGEYKQNELWDADHATIRPSTSKTMREMLVGNRQIYRANPKYDKGFYVGGKTGTAQAVRDGKYVMNETIASYVGFGAENKDAQPKYVIMVKFWEKGRALGGDTHAMPAFNEMSEYMIDYLKLRK
jgi:cell division protein FtsI/penicillin-binding protein 2